MSTLYNKQITLHDIYKIIKKNIKSIVQINMVRYTNSKGIDNFRKIEKK